MGYAKNGRVFDLTHIQYTCGEIRLHLEQLQEWRSNAQYQRSQSPDAESRRVWTEHLEELDAKERDWKRRLKEFEAKAPLYMRLQEAIEVYLELVETGDIRQVTFKLDVYHGDGELAAQRAMRAIRVLSTWHNVRIWNTDYQFVEFIIDKSMIERICDYEEARDVK